MGTAAKKTTELPPLLLPLGLVILIFVIYGQIARHEFINYDDPLYVTSNEMIQNGLSAEVAIWAATETQIANYWHPITLVSHFIDYQLFGDFAGAHLLVNLLIHTINSLLLLHILVRSTGAWWRSALVAALFAIHPLHVESVAWVSERKDVLSSFFAMLAILAYLRFVEEQTLRRYALIVLFFFLGLLSKPMVVTLPFVLLLLDYWPLQRFSRPSTLTPTHKAVRRIIEFVPLLVMSVGVSLVTVFAQEKAGMIAASPQISYPERFGIAASSYVGYIEKLAVPIHLSIDYVHSGDTPSPLRIVLCLGLLGAVTTTAILARRRHPYLIVGWLWYLGTFVPVMRLVQVGNQKMADRYTYMPTIGIFIMISWGIYELTRTRPRMRQALCAAAVIWVLTLSAMTFQQVHRWRDSEALFGYAASVTPNSRTVRNNYGTALLEKGRVEEAEKQFRAALALEPGFIDARNNLGAVLLMRGEHSEAEAIFKRLLHDTPRDLDVIVNLAVALAGQERWEEAIATVQVALKLDPEFTKAEVLLQRCEELRAAHG